MGESYHNPVSGGGIAAGRYRMSTFWRNLPTGWTELTYTGTPPGAGMTMYSGMALDAAGGKCYLVGGGHNDSLYSGIMTFDLETRAFSEEMPSLFTANPTVEQARAVIDNAAYPGALLQNGVPYQPISRHTYLSVNWVEALDVFTLAGGSTYSGGYGNGDYLWWDAVVQPTGAWLGSPMDFWTYSPTSNSYSYKGSALTNLSNFYATRSIAHPSDAVLYAFKADGNGWLQCLVIDPSTGATTPRTGRANDDTAGAYAMAFDPTGRYIYILVQNSYNLGTFRLLKYDTQTDSYALMPVNGGSLPAFTYDEVFTLELSTKTGKLYAISRISQPLKIYDPATGIWTDQSLSAVTGLDQTSGRFKYDKRRDAFVLIYQTGGNIKVFAYRE